MLNPSDPSPTSAPARLDTLIRGRTATIASIDWAALRQNEARRMRELGFDEGVQVEKLHAAPLGQDPIAIRVGRMTIAIRRVQAAAVFVTVDGAQADAFDDPAMAAE